jgi:putative hemolysin
LENILWGIHIKKILSNLLGFEIIRSRAKKAAETHSGNPYTKMLEICEICVDEYNIYNNLPTEGGCITLANHPFGIADALTLMSICIDKRSDTLLLVNSIVASAPVFGDNFIPLYIMNEENATINNARSLKSAYKHIKSGGHLIVFPSGEVSSHFHKFNIAKEPVWSDHFTRIAIKCNIPILPVRFHGSNPMWFAALSLVSDFCKNILIIRAFTNGSPRYVSCSGGSIIHAQDIKNLDNPNEYIREKIFSISRPNTHPLKNLPIH